MRSSEFVDQLLEQLQDATSGWFYSVFGKMLQYISHNIFDPLVRWRVQANRLLGVTEDDEAMKGLGDAKMETEGDDKSNTSMTSDDVQWYCYEDIDSCLKTLEQNPVLEFLDAAKEEKSLRSKLTEIDRIALKGRELFQQLSEHNITSVPQEMDFGDKILKQLIALMDSLEVPLNSLSNVDPIGKAEVAWTRSHLKGAISFRNWVSSIDHINKARERRAYVESIRLKAVSIVEELEGIPCFDVSQISTKRKEALTLVEKLVGDTGHLNSLEQKVEGLLAQDGGLSLAEAHDCLEKVGECSVVLLPEERLAVRIDLMKWSQDAETVFSSGERVSFEQLEKIHQELQQVKLGISATRSRIVDELRRDEEIENKIQVFAGEDLSRIFGHIAEKTETFFQTSMQWKVKAEGIIYTLRLHGNTSAGDSLQSHKVPSMIDIRKVHELVSEYATMKVASPDLMETLVRILEDAEGWSNGLAENLSKEESTLRDNWSMVVAERMSRPKGLIMHPTRQVTDSLVDLFAWYDRVQTSLSALNNPLDDTFVPSLYHLLAEGMTVVQLFSRSTSSGYEMNIHETAERLESSHDIRPTARAVNIEKIQGYVPGLALVHKIATDTFDAREGFPLTSLLWADWHLEITDLVSCCMRGEAETKTKQKLGRSFSLSDAINIRSSRPCGKVDLNGTDQSQPWNHTTDITRELDAAILAGESLETEIREAIASQREFRRGVVQKSDAVREHLAGMKELLAKFRERASSNHDLSLDPTLEGLLETQIKIFSWMTRTLSYPFLYLDEASYSNITEGELTRIPWDALVTLYDRMPADDDDLKVDDFTLVAMRVRELFSAASKWQGEISRHTSLSNRGGKRRAPNIGTQQSSQDEETSTSNVQIEHMQRLAADPVLLKVAMPREDAMHRVLRSSTEFEAKLQKILGEDFSVQNPDRAAYPDSDSLVGKNGDFILFRLTGSELFQAMLPDMYELAEVAEDVLAETPGKHTFDWLKRSVDWIDDLNSCVAKESPFVDCRKKLLVIPCADARRLVELGNDLFLNLAEDIKQTFSSHGIFVTTNKQGKSYRVAVKKSGAHHSMGGTVVRWCPILFECLKADVARLGEWELELTQLLSEFNKFFQRKGSHTKPTEDDLYRWHCFKERTSTLLEEGAQTLVVAPEANFVSSFTNLLSSQESYLAQHSSPQLHQIFAKRWFSEGTSQLNDRETLLDSLMTRRELSEDRKPTKDILDEDESSFRQICRSYVSSSLGRVARVAGTGKSRDIDSLCALKAWEIECEMYDSFQQELGVTKVSDEYKSKARNLRVSMDDRNNLSLGLQILTGELNVSTVVKMSKEQLASHKTKNARAKAEKDALNASNLTPRLAISPQKGEPATKPVSSDFSSSGSKSTIEVVERNAPTKHGLSSILRPSKIPPNPVSAAAGAPAGAKKSSKEPKEAVVKAQTSTLKTVSKVPSKAAAPPPPPPSLATSFNQSHDKTASSSQLRIESSSGSDSFKFDILNLRLTFSAALYLEASGHESLRRFLPSCLKERGRLGDKEFSRFISSKLEGGKWAAISLRLVTLSDNDHDTYKRFYQDYEGKRRIAMLGVNSETKVFLVTPRYHSAAKKAGVVSLSHKSSTYAVVLTKDIRVVQN
eukprot:Nitzschia sp. Nitz4//scaffold2_size372955//13852//18732//NITZ4_000354-RA/size372955-processed-gene-0.465-mRNA-1//-1//CDS//3329546569//5861//frame0